MGGSPLVFLGINLLLVKKTFQLSTMQANSNAREGRVMIYNLVEAAQEFLSEIVPLGHSHESVSFPSHQEKS